MKITTLVENSTLDNDLKTEHGLSLYIETENHKILFDTGWTDLFIDNAAKLGIDLREVDMVVVSHAHADHTGGLIPFLKLNQKAKVYLKKEVIDQQYFYVKEGKKDPIGVTSELLEYMDRLVFLETACTLIGNLFILANFDQHYPSPKSNSALYKQVGTDLMPDDFDHELIQVIHTEKGMVVLSGCAHHGILNIISTVQRFFPKKSIFAVVSGFHLVDRANGKSTETDEEIASIGHELKRLCPSANFYTGHCTSKRAMDILSTILKEQLHQLSTGLITSLS